MNKKIIGFSSFVVLTSATLPMAIGMKAGDGIDKKIAKEGFYIKNISTNKLSFMPSKIRITGTNGYAKIFPFSGDTTYEISATRSGTKIINVNNLQNGDIVQLKITSQKNKGSVSKYKVEGLKKTFLTPVWPKSYSDLRKVISNGGDEYFKYELYNENGKRLNGKVSVYKAVVKNNNIYEVSPAFNKMAYLDGRDSIVSWNTNNKFGSYATISSDDQSTGFKSSFGTYNYGDINAQINTGKIRPVSGFNASADLDKALVYLKFNDTGAHRFDSIEAQVSDVVLKIYDADNKLKSRNILPSQSSTLYHKSSNWFTGLLSTLDPVSSLVKGVTGLGAFVAGAFASGLNGGHYKGVEWARAFSGYDQNSELAKIAQWVNMGLSIAGDLLTIPLTGGGSSLKLVSSLSKGMTVAKLAKYGGETGVLFSKISKLLRISGNSYRKLSSISEIMGVAGETAKLIQTFVENPSMVSQMQFMQTTLGLSNLAIGKLFSNAIGKAGSKSAEIANNAFEAFRKMPVTLLDNIDKMNQLNVRDIYRNVTQNKAKAILLNLDRYKIPKGGSYEIDLKYRWRLGAAFSGSLFHWWSNSYGKLEMDLNKSHFITTMKNVNGIAIPLKDKNIL